MKNILKISAMLSIFCTSYAQDQIVYAPSSYMCAPLNHKCTCVQYETSYFPATFDLKNTCEGFKPFKIIFNDGFIDPQTNEATPMYVYQSAGIILQSQTKVKSVDNTHWEWSPFGYSCNPKNFDTHACPMTLLPPKTNSIFIH